MWRSRMFWQLFASSGMLVLFALGLLGSTIAQRVEQNEVQQIEDGLRNRALLIAEAIRGRAVGEIRGLIGRLAHLETESSTRITLMSEVGEVVVESSEDPSHLENHLQRPEIQEATKNRFGKATRYSTTLGQNMMYLALDNRDTGSPVGFIRVALPLASVQAEIAHLGRLVWSTVALTAGLALLVAFLLAQRLSRPLHELSQGADQIAAGAYGHRVYAEGPQEVQQLAQSFNNMSETLATTFSQLEEDRQQLRTVLSSMVEGVIAIGPDHRILFANDRAGELFEFQAPRAVGRPLWDLVRQRPIQEVVRSAMKDGASHSSELTWSGPGARNLSVHVAGLPASRGAVLVFHDNTELRRLENLRQEFVANVSHELKTPLAIIKACVETLIDGAMDDPAHRGKFLERIDDQSERLHALILDLLRLARIESETEVFSMEELDLETIVESTLSRHHTLAEGKGQKLETVPAAPGDGPVTAWADEEAVQQILDNLVDNALKYTPEGGAVRIRWGRHDDGVFLEVSDTGIGIPESELPRIFERFYRVDKARSRELGGTGLGLSIVKHLVQAMQGSLRAESVLSQGSTFFVRLPAPNILDPL